MDIPPKSDRKEAHNILELPEIKILLANSF